MFDKLKAVGKSLKREIKVYKLIIKDRQTPMLPKIILGIAVGYALLPFDIIPDFIPFFGQLDDAIILPILIFLALKMVPEEIVQDCRKRVR